MKPCNCQKIRGSTNAT